MADTAAQETLGINLRARHRVRNGIFLLAAVCLAVLGLMRLLGTDVAILRISAISAGLLVVTLFMTYRAMATALDAGLKIDAELAPEREPKLTEPKHDPSSGTLPPRPE
jgi:hypothetical protein